MHTPSYQLERLLLSPRTPEQALAMLPHTTQEIEDLLKQSQAYIQEKVTQLTEWNDLDFERFDQLDQIRDISYRVASALALIEYTHPDETLRNTAHTAGLAFMAWLTPLIELNPALYKKLEATHKKIDEAELSPEKKYYIEETLKGFQRSGVHLPEAQQQRLKIVYDELNTLGSQFERAIAQDTRFIIVTRDELPGLSDLQCAPFLQPDGTYKLGVDYPTYGLVMSECSSELTRQRLWKEFNARAHPGNLDILNKIATLRHELALTLGYPSFADYQIEDSMAGSRTRAQEFLDDLVARGRDKACQEAAILLQYARKHMGYTHDQLKPWDAKYIDTRYRKQVLEVDDQLVRQYFPAQQTIDRLLQIYQDFLGMKFKTIQPDPQYPLWHPDVQMIAAYDTHDTLLGYLMLDLYPRPGKFTHACHLSVVHAACDDTGTRVTPSVAAVIANFPTAHGDTPALFLLNDVNTFFHEFGHAVHGLWGATRMRGFSGTSTKRDFVELPSQMLEEWLAQPHILKLISGHYQTGAPLPDDLIERIVSLHKWSNGMDVMRQLVFSQLSLRCFDERLQDDICQTYQALHTAYRPYSWWSEDDHFISSFGHLVGYGAQYYGYLWSKVFALDIFYTLKKAGLSPQIGARYRDMVLVPGGSQDPYDMITNFLGRQPSNAAYFEHMGF